jgi:hypothetical protein
VVSDGASCRKSGLGGANRDRSWAIQTSIVVDTFGWIGRVTSVILYQSVWTAVRTLFPALNRDVGDVTVASAETAIDHRSTGAPTGESWGIVLERSVERSEHALQGASDH